MVAEVASIEVTLKLLGVDRFQAGMRGTSSISEQTGARVAQSMERVASSTEKAARAGEGMSRSDGALRAVAFSALRAETSVLALSRAFTGVGTAIGGLAGGVALNAFKNYADTATTIQNKLAVVIPIQTQRAKVDQQIFDTAQRTRTSYESTAAIFSRMSLSSKELGASQADVLRVVETTQKALKAGGATSSESASIATQLTQALGSGRGLAGDELKSIAENSPVLLQAIATEFGVTTGALKDMGANGELQAKRVFAAIMKAGSEVDRVFAQTTPTIADGIQQIDNALTRYIGNVDKSLNATKALNNGLQFVANNIANIGDGAAVAVAGIAASFLGRGASKATSAIIDPFKSAREAAARNLADARSLSDNRFAERTSALGSVLAARYRAQQVEATPSTALAGPKAIADLIAAEKRVEGQRESLRTATEKLAAAEKARNDVAAATVTASKSVIQAEERAAAAVANRREALTKGVGTYRDAGMGIGSAEGALPKRSSEKLAAAVAEREDLARKLAEVDARAAAAQAQADTLSTPSAGVRTRARAERAAALTAEIEQEVQSRNRVGLALQQAIRVSNEKEEALEAANASAKAKSAADVERLGSRLVAAESAVVKGRQDLAERAARTASGQGKARSADAVLKNIEEEIQAQERLAALTAKRDTLSASYLDAMDRAPNATGSLKQADVKALSQARQARDSLFRDLEQMDAQIAAKTAERDRQSGSIGPRSVRSLARDASNSTRVGELNGVITAAASERADIAKRLAAVDSTIVAGEESLATRTAAARARAIEITSQAGQRLRDVQQSLVTDLATLNERRKAVISSEVANEEDRGRRLMALDKQIAENRQNQAGIKQAINLNATGVDKARQAVELDAGGQREAAKLAQAEAEAAVVASRKASEEVAQTVARAQRAATVTGIVGSVARTSLTALGGIVSLLGGPLAATLTAASVGLAGYAIYQARAAEEVRKHAEAVKTLEERTKALNDAQGVGKLRSDRQIVEDTNTAKNALRALEDNRNGLRNSLQGALRTAAPSAQRGAVKDEFGGLDDTRSTTVIDDAAKRAGTSVLDLVNNLDAYPKASTEAQAAARKFADTLLDAAKADPRLADKAIEADEYAKKLVQTAEATRKYAEANKAASEVKLPTPLDADVEYKVGQKFDAEAATKGAKAYIEELGDEIGKLNDTPIVFSGIQGSTEELRGLVSEMAAARATMLGIVSGTAVPVPIANAIEAFKSGKTSAAEYGAELQDLKTKYPDFAPLIQSLIDANERILKAQATAQQLGVDLSALDGKVVDILIKIGVSGQIPDVAAMAAKEQAKADKVLADQASANKIGRVRASQGDIIADVLQAGANNPALDLEKFKSGRLEQADIARDQRNRMPDLKEAIDDQVKSGSSAVEKTVQETLITNLKAQGKDRDAALLQFQRENPTVAPDLAKRLVNEKADADDALEAYKKSQKPAKAPKKSQGEKDEATLAKKLQELDQDARVSGLDTFDQKTVRFAQSAKVATDQIEAFIKAAQSGDMSNLPPTMQQIYEKMMLLEGVKLAKNALDEIYPYRKLARELQELQAAANASPEIAANLELIEMRIRADNAPDWAKGLSSGVKDAAKSVADGTATIGGAMETLKTKIIGLALDTAFKPLETAFTSMLTKLGGQNSGGFDLLSLFGGGGGGQSLAASDSVALAGVPMFATGVTALGMIDGPGTGTSDSILARVSKGESIVTAKATARHRSLIEAMNADRLPAFAAGGIIADAVNTMSMPAIEGARQAVATASEAGRSAKNVDRRPLSVAIDVRGATGNVEVQRMVSQGVQAGMQAVTKQIGRDLGDLSHENRLRFV